MKNYMLYKNMHVKDIYINTRKKQATKKEIVFICKNYK